MKLQSSKKKRTLIIVLAILAVILVAAVIFAVVLFTKNNNNNGNEESVVKGIIVNSVPKTEYYVGEEIDLTGLKIQIVMSKVGDLRFVTYPNNDLSVTGYDLSKSGEQIITVTYQGYTTTFKINVKEYSAPNPTLVSIEVCDMPTSYSRNDWNEGGPIIKSAYLKLTYSDGTVVGSYQETPLLYSYIEPYNTVDNGENVTYLTITYTERGITVSTTVTITITE